MEEASSRSPGEMATSADSIILEEEIDPNYIPSEDEVLEYAKWLGMDLKKDQDLYWVAREGLMAPLPKNWKPCKTKDTEDIYYFNFATGESTWDHPCDGYYKRLYEEEKKKKELIMKENTDEKRTKAKQDVEQLLGKNEKKKKKKTTELNNLEAPKKSSSTVASLEKKPLPGIKPKMSLTEPLIGIGSMTSSSQKNIMTSIADSDSDDSVSRTTTNTATTSSTKERDMSTSLDRASSSRSRLSSRLKSAVSDSGEASGGEELMDSSNYTRSSMESKYNDSGGNEAKNSSNSSLDKISSSAGSTSTSLKEQKKRLAEELELLQNEHDLEIKKLRQRWKNEIDEEQHEHDQILNKKRREWEEEQDELQDKFKRQRNKVQQEMDELDNEFDRKKRIHKEKCTKLEEEQEQANNKLESLQQMISKLKASSQDLQENMNKEESKESYKDSTTNNYTEIIKELKTKLSESKEEVDFHKRKAESLQLEVMNLEEEYTLLLESAEKKASATLKTELTDDAKSVVTMNLEKEIASLKFEIKQLRLEKDILEAKAESMKSESLTKSKLLEEETGTLRSKLAVKDAELEELRQQAIVSRETITRLQSTQLTTSSTTISSTVDKSNVEDKQRQLEKSLRERLSQSEEEILKFQSMIQSLHREVAEERAEKKDALDKLQLARQQVTEEKDALLALQTKDKNLELQLQEIKLQADYDRQELVRVRQDLMQKTEQLTFTKQEYDSLSLKQSQSAVSNGSSSTIIDNIDSSIHKREMERLQRLLSTSENECISREEALRASQSKLMEISAELVSVKLSVEDNQNKLKRLTQQIERQDSELQEKDKKILLIKQRESETQESLDRSNLELHQSKNKLNMETEEKLRLQKLLVLKEDELEAAIKTSLMSATTTSLVNHDSTIITALTIEIDQLKQHQRQNKITIDELSFQIKVKDTEITRTKQELQESSSSIKRLKEDIVTHEETMNQLNKVQSQMQQLQRELSNALHEVEQKDLDIKRIKEEWKSSHSSDNQSKSLLAENERLESELVKKSRLLSQNEIDLNEVNYKLSQKDTEINRHKSEISRLLLLETKLSNIVTEKSELESEVFQLKKLSTRNTSELEDFQYQITQKDNECKRLRDELFRLSNIEEKYRSLVSEKESLEQDIMKKSRLVTQYEIESNETTYKLSQRDNENKRMKEEILRLTAVEDKQRIALLESNNEVEQLRMNIQKLQGQLQSSSSIESEETLRIRKNLELLLSQERSSNTLKENQIQNLQEDLSRLKSQLQLVSVGTDRDKESGLVASLRLDLTSAITRYQSAEESLRDLRIKSQNMELQLHDLQMEKSRMTNQLEEAKSSNKNLTQQVEKFSKLLEDSKYHHHALELEIQSLKKDRDGSTTTTAIGQGQGGAGSRDAMNSALEASNRELQSRLFKADSEIEYLKDRIEKLTLFNTTASTTATSSDSEALLMSKKTEMLLRAENEDRKRETEALRGELLQAASAMSHMIQYQHSQFLAGGAIGTVGEALRAPDQGAARGSGKTAIDYFHETHTNNNNYESNDQRGGAAGGSRTGGRSSSRAGQADGALFIDDMLHGGGTSATRVPMRSWKADDSPPQQYPTISSNLNTGYGNNGYGFGGEDDRGRNPKELETTLLSSVLKDFLHRTHQMNANNNYNNNNNTNTNTNNQNGSNAYWSKKLSEEKKFLKDAQVALREEKIEIRKKQTTLASQRQQWKQERELLAQDQHHHHSNRNTNNDAKAKAALKRDGAELNKITELLNDRIESIRKAVAWLEDREVKVNKLSQGIKLFSQSNYTDTNVLSSLEELSNELDENIEDFGLESFGTLSYLPSPSSELYLTNSEDNYDNNSRSRSGGGGSTMEHFPRYQSGNNIQYEPQQQQQQQHQYISPTKGLGSSKSGRLHTVSSARKDNMGNKIRERRRSSSATRYQSHRSEELKDNNTDSDVYSTTHAQQQFPPPPPPLPAAYMNMIDPYTLALLNRIPPPASLPYYSAVPLSHQSQQPLPWLQHPSNSLPLSVSTWNTLMPTVDPSIQSISRHSPLYNTTSTGGGSGTSSNIGGLTTSNTSNEIRRQYQQYVTSDRAHSKEAYDQHASWLDNLRREIGRFSHLQSSSSTTATTTAGMDYKTTPLLATMGLGNEAVLLSSELGDC